MSFLSNGKIKENNFAKHFSKVKFSSESEDIHEHWDLKIETKIDVKGLKKINRSDSFTNENYHFIEIINVNGKLGWLYGDSDFFAFETDNYWILVDKKLLQEFVKNNVNKDIQVDSTDKALYCIYSREGRKDKITLVKTLDLIMLSNEIIKKEIDNITHELGESIIPEVREKQRLNKVLKKT